MRLREKAELVPALTSPPEEAIFTEARRKKIAEPIKARGISEPRVMAAMAKVSRHQFVLLEYLNQAYDNHPLPMGNGQTISQLYIAALMTSVQPGT